jgi:hypothetical protein
MTFILVAWLTGHEMLNQKTHHPSLCLVYVCFLTALGCCAVTLLLAWRAFKQGFGVQWGIFSEPDTSNSFDSSGSGCDFTFVWGLDAAFILLRGAFLCVKMVLVARKHKKVKIMYFSMYV